MAAMTAPVSMTAFATLRGQGTGALAAFSWVWEVRSVNGKGLDLRLRLPDWIEGLEPAVRAELTRRIGRGNVAAGLKLTRASGAEALRVNPAGAGGGTGGGGAGAGGGGGCRGGSGAPSAADVLAMRGVTETAAPEDTDTPPCWPRCWPIWAPRWTTSTRCAVPKAGAGRCADRAAGPDRGAGHRGARSGRGPPPQGGRNLARALARVAQATDADPARVAQELALLAVKADVTEELDRLTAHVAAARALLAQGGPIGRKFDFLTQEFNREANTLCSKAAYRLTQIGLDLKHLIDQMREQVQNLE
jgi:hypothetical protein